MPLIYNKFQLKQKVLSPLATSIAVSVTSNIVLQAAIQGAIIGAATGFTGGFTSNLILSGGDINSGKNFKISKLHIHSIYYYNYLN